LLRFILIIAYYEMLI